MTQFYVNVSTVHPPVEGTPLLMNLTVFQEHASTNLLGKKKKRKMYPECSYSCLHCRAVIDGQAEVFTATVPRGFGKE